MVTPVGIAYTFRMLVDTTKGPLAPIWLHFGWGAIAWVKDPWAARWVIVLGDCWQWIPFMFIVLLAALENLPRDQVVGLVIDTDNEIKWQKGFVSRELLEGEAGQPGARAKLIYLMGKRKMEMVETVLVNELPDRLDGKMM